MSEAVVWAPRIVLCCLAIVTLFAEPTVAVISTASSSKLPHVVSARDKIASHIAHVKGRNHTLTVVTCALNTAAQTVDAVSFKGVHAKSQSITTAHVFSNLVVYGPATGIGVCVNSAGHITALRILTPNETPCCGYWDPDNEIIVRAHDDELFAGLHGSGASKNFTGPLTAASIELQFSDTRDLSPLPRLRHRISKSRSTQRNAT